MVMPLKRVIIFIGDVGKCAQFYADVFRFAVMPGGSAEWAELETGGIPEGHVFQICSR